MRRAARLTLVIASIATLVSCTGYRPGGPQQSLDQYTYESTADFPTTIVLTDWTTRETIWSYDIPVGKQLSIAFYENQKKDNPTRPDIMRWQLQDRGQDGGSLSNALPVPPSINRRVDVVLRASAEAVPTPEPVAR